MAENKTEESKPAEVPVSAFAFRTAQSIEAFMDHHTGELKKNYQILQAVILNFHAEIQIAAEKEPDTMISLKEMSEKIKKTFFVETHTKGDITPEDGQRKE